MQTKCPSHELSSHWQVPLTQSGVVSAHGGSQLGSATQMPPAQTMPTPHELSLHLQIPASQSGVAPLHSGEQGALGTHWTATHSSSALQQAVPHAV